MTVIHSEFATIATKLTSLGLTELVLLQAIKCGILARQECTANHPPIYAGITAWANTVRGLREQLIPLNWTRSDEGNYPLVIHPSGSIAIALATGDENTGSIEANPMTKYSKGPNTQAMVSLNQMTLFQDMQSSETNFNSDADARLTWLLLVARVGNTVKAELSLPINCDGKVNAWRERIILPNIDIDPTVDIFATPIVPNMPDIEIDVQRKA